MDKVQSSFQRVEKKYLLRYGQYEVLRRGMEAYVKPDEHPCYQIGNIYYDTDDYRLVRASLEKPVFKEKLRVRSYGIPTSRDRVFAELKRKYDGVVYKRRITLAADMAAQRLRAGVFHPDDQIGREIDWFLRCYRPRPMVFIGYDREAFAGADDPALRVTFDTALRGRSYDVDLRAGDYGTLILPEDMVLMELKIPGGAPLWLARLLSENGICASSFSKYGAYYKQRIGASPFCGVYRQGVKCYA